MEQITVGNGPDISISSAWPSVLFNPFFSNLSCTITAGRFWYSQLVLNVGLHENKIVLLDTWP